MNNINFSTRVGRNFYLSNRTKYRLIGIVIGVCFAGIFIVFKMIIPCYQSCTASEHEIRYQTFGCDQVEDISKSKNCVIDQFYMEQKKQHG